MVDRRTIEELRAEVKAVLEEVELTDEQQAEIDEAFDKATQQTQPEEHTVGQNPTPPPPGTNPQQPHPQEQPSQPPPSQPPPSQPPPQPNPQNPQTR